MKKKILFMALILSSRESTQAQGCVAIRNTGAVCTKLHTGNDKGWKLNASYRFFKSFRHFVGTEEQKERTEQHTEVINWQHAMDISLVRDFNKRWSLAASIPLIANKRSSLYEHYGNNSNSPRARNNTRSFGMGDMRITFYRWLADPVKNMRWNIKAGLGLKFPSGDYEYQDFFIKNDSTKVLGPVDQSIQLGDGGTGIITELNAFYNFFDRFGGYAGFYYLINPREQNGVSTARGGTISATAIKYGSSTMSVPDQYMIRLGINYSVEKLTVSAGFRKESVPSRDLIGGNGGFRRPGWVVSAEPGISLQFKKFSAFATVPVAIKRSRTQSNADKLQTAATGIYRHGDAAFADYSVNLGFSVKL